MKLIYLISESKLKSMWFRVISMSVLLLFAVLLILTPTSTKIAGAVWLLCIVIAIFSVIFLPNPIASYVKTERSEKKLFNPFLFWIKICAVGLLLKLLGVMWWAEDLSERQAEFRLLFMAIAAYWIVQKWSPKLQDNKYFFVILCLHAVFFAVWSVLYARNGLTPTNRIPWATGLGLISCVGFALMWYSQVSLPLKIINGLTIIFSCIGIAYSDVRGSYWVVLWFTLYTIFYSLYFLIKNKKYIILIIGSIFLYFILLNTVQLISKTERINIAIQEYKSWRYSPDKNAGINSSVGIRLHMLDKGRTVFLDSPWVGYGTKERQKMIVSWGKDSKNSEVESLKYLHNEYLNNVIDYGIFGMLGGLIYLYGLIRLFLHYRNKNHVISISFLGLFFVHTLGSASNVNFIHNYYVICFSLAIFLSMLLDNKNENKDLT